MPKNKVLIVASTFPASTHDKVPTFVKDQVIALKQLHPELDITVLAPHDARAHTQSVRHHTDYSEFRFHYFWPHRFEKLTGRGILPTLKQNPIYFILVPFLIGSEFFAILRLSRKLEPTIIYAHWFMPQGITAGMVSVRTGIPFAYTSHSSDVAILRKLPIIGPYLVQRFTQKAESVTVVSRRSLEKLQTFFAPADWRRLKSKVAVIPMGVHLDNHSERRIGDSGTSQNILFIGRLVEKKGVQHLLPAFKNLLEAHPKITLTIAGDGPWFNRLQAQANNLAIPKHNISFKGYVTGYQKKKVILNADIFVVPSIITTGGDAEGLPVSLLEGLAAEKICIATAESGADDIIESGKNGYIVAQGDVAELTTTLKKALGLKLRERNMMQEAALKAAQQFAWPEIAQRHYEHLFKKSHNHNASARDKTIRYAKK